MVSGQWRMYQAVSAATVLFFQRHTSDLLQPLRRVGRCLPLLDGSIAHGRGAQAHAEACISADEVVGRHRHATFAIDQTVPVRRDKRK
jgi:hypothetical protein